MYDPTNTRPPAPELSPDELCTVIEFEFEFGTPAFEELACDEARRLGRLALEHLDDGPGVVRANAEPITIAQVSIGLDREPARARVFERADRKSLAIGEHHPDIAECNHARRVQLGSEPDTAVAILNGGQDDASLVGIDAAPEGNVVSHAPQDTARTTRLAVWFAHSRSKAPDHTIGDLG